MALVQRTSRITILRLLLRIYTIICAQSLTETLLIRQPELAILALAALVPLAQQSGTLFHRLSGMHNY